MAVLVVDGAIVTCTFGAVPSALAALPANPTRGSNSAAATIMDFAPMVNIQPFGICSSPANPQVIAATSAAAGVFTPQPCIPATAIALGPGLAGGDGRRSAGARQCLHVQLLVGGRHLGHQPGPAGRTGLAGEHSFSRPASNFAIDRCVKPNELNFRLSSRPLLSLVSPSHVFPRLF